MAQQKQRQFLDKKSKKLEGKKKTLKPNNFRHTKWYQKKNIFHQNLRNTQPPNNKPEQNKQTIVGDRHEVAKTTEKRRRTDPGGV